VKLAVSMGRNTVQLDSMAKWEEGAGRISFLVQIEWLCLLFCSVKIPAQLLSDLLSEIPFVLVVLAS